MASTIIKDKKHISNPIQKITKQANDMKVMGDRDNDNDSGTQQHHNSALHTDKFAKWHEVRNYRAAVLYSTEGAVY